MVNKEEGMANEEVEEDLDGEGDRGVDAGMGEGCFGGMAGAGDLLCRGRGGLAVVLVVVVIVDTLLRVSVGVGD